MAEKGAPPAKQPEPAPPPVVLAPAGESGNPLVHQALAERGIAISNGDQDTVAALTARLAELGVK